jgi:threonine 3-dehydrogenase
MTSANDSAELPRKTVALVKRGDVESYELEQVELRRPKDDEVVIRVDAVALCGSDITLYKWNDLAKVRIQK